jgi:hypothetical protein
LSSDYPVDATALSATAFSIRSLGEVSLVSTAWLNTSRKLRGASTGSRLARTCVALSASFELRDGSKKTVEEDTRANLADALDLSIFDFDGHSAAHGELVEISGKSLQIPWVYGTS